MNDRDAEAFLIAFARAAHAAGTPAHRLEQLVDHMGTRLGLVMRATQFDRETAQAFGIPVDRVYSLTFALGAALACIAGVLIVPIQQAHYLMGLDPLLLSFIVVIVGGLGSLRGTVVAAFVIGISEGVISVFFTPTLAKIIATLFVALVLVFRPQGLFGGRRP